MGTLTIYLKHGHVLTMHDTDADDEALERLRNSLHHSQDTLALNGPNSVGIIRWVDVVAIVYTDD